jgi:preprotein translocase subunit SecG
MLLALWYHVILSIFFGFVALILMGVILLQRGKGVGLAGAFGGAGGNSAFGAKTGDVLTWATIVLAIFFLIIACVLNFVFMPLKSNLLAPTTIAAPGPDPGAMASDGVPVMPTSAPVNPTPAPASTPPSPPVAPAATQPQPANPVPAAQP